MVCMINEIFIPFCIPIQKSGPLSSSDVEFVSSLSEEFSSIQLFECVENALKYVMTLPEELDQGVYAS